MTSTSKQIALGEKPPAKKKKEPPVTELVNIDVNTWKIPNDFDLVDTAIELVDDIGMNLPNTFHIIKNRIENDFLITDGTLLWTNKPCPGCSKKHTSSIDVETKESIQQCSDSNAIFKDQKNKKFVQVQLICPTCKKNHLTMDYSSWQTLSDKRCSDCQQKTAAADATKRKKESRREKKDENTPQLTPETNSEETDITMRSDEYHCSICGIRKRIDFKFEDGFLICSCGNPIEKTEEDIYSCPHCSTCFPISLLPTDGRCTRCAKHPLLLDLEGKKITKKKLEELQSLPEEDESPPTIGIDEVAEAIEELEIDPLLKEKYKNMEEWEICQSVKAELESMGMKRYYSAFVKKENKIATNINQVILLADEYIQKARAELNISDEESSSLNDFMILTQEFGPTIKRLVHPLYSHDFYLTTENNLFSAMKNIHQKEYWGKNEFTNYRKIFIMNHQSYNIFKVTNQSISTLNESDAPLEFTQLKPEDWLSTLFPAFEMSPRGDKKEKSEVPDEEMLPQGNKEQTDKTILKADNGTRKGIPFVAEAKKKKKEKQISLQSFTTMRINVDKLKTTDFQFRSKLNDEHIAFLKDSMNQKRDDGSNMGNIEAVLVREIDDGFFEIISGHHRIAAAKKAKLKSLKCEILNVDDAAAIEVAIIANFSRMEMSPVEEARALKAYRDLTDLSFERIGKRIGKSKQWISARLSLLNTSDIVQKSLETGQITPAHVKAVGSLELKEQDKLLKKVVKEGMTTNSLEWEVRTKKREQDELEKAVEDSKKFAKYIDKNLEELQNKTISKNTCWSSENDKKLYDIWIGDLFTKANLREYRHGNAKTLKPFYDILKENNIKLVDGRRLEQKLKDEALESERIKREEAKKKDPCKICDVKLEIDEKLYCPIADPTKKNPNCKHVWESNFSSGWDIPKELQKLCFICSKEIKPGEPFVSTRKEQNFHGNCYYHSFVHIKELKLDPCPKCKKRGRCDIQNVALNLVQNHKIELSLNSCEEFKDESTPETYLIKFDDYHDAELFNTDNLENELESELNDIAEYILDKAIPLENISSAEDEESQAVFEKLKIKVSDIKEAKSGKYQYILSDDGDIDFILTDLETEEEVDCEREDMLLYLADEEIPLDKIKAIDEESEKILQELQKESSDS